MSDTGAWDPELAIVAGRVDVLVEAVQTARTISARRFALDMLARGLLAADAGAISPTILEAARAMKVDASTLDAASAPRLPHAVSVPLVAVAHGRAFVRQVHVSFDPARRADRGFLAPDAERAIRAALALAASHFDPPPDVAEHALVAATPAVLAAARVEGRSLAAATLVSAMALWSDRPVRADRVVTGALVGGRLASVGELRAKVIAAREQGFAAIVVPAADRELACAEGGLEVLAVERVEELLEATLAPRVVARLDPERVAREARALASDGWRGYRWPSIAQQLARLSALLPGPRVDLRVEVLTRLAAAHRHSGDPVGCLEVLRTATALVDSEEGQRAVPDGPISELWMQVAMTERQLCHLGLAARAAARATRVATRARLRGTRIKALGTQGLVALTQGRIEPAIEAFASALDLTLLHQPHEAARSRAYLVEALGLAGHAVSAERLLEEALREVRDEAAEGWVRTSGAAALLSLGAHEEAVRVLDVPCIHATLMDAPLPGLLARRRLGIALARTGATDRGLELLASSPLVHGRALAPHLGFLAHVNVLHEAEERLRAGRWDADIAGRAREAMRGIPSHGDVTRFLGAPLIATARALARDDARPPPAAALRGLLARCARLN